MDDNSHKMSDKRGLSQFDMILNASIFGVISYTALYGLYWTLGVRIHISTLNVDSKKLFQPEVLLEIVIATTIAVGLSIIHIYGEMLKLFTRFVQNIRATRTYGDEDVWDFVHSFQTLLADLATLARNTVMSLNDASTPAPS